MKKTKTSSRTKKKVRTRQATGRSGVIELKPGLMKMRTARAIAKTLKSAADAGGQGRHSSFHSAMAALNLLIRHLDLQKARLSAVREELRKLYGKDDESGDGPSDEVVSHQVGVDLAASCLPGVINRMNPHFATGLL